MRKSFCGCGSALKWISEHTPVPNFGFWDLASPPRGNIGGYVLDGYHHGELAANMALKILAGEKPGKHLSSDG